MCTCSLHNVILHVCIQSIIVQCGLFHVVLLVMREKCCKRMKCVTGAISVTSQPQNDKDRTHTNTDCMQTMSIS